MDFALNLWAEFYNNHCTAQCSNQTLNETRCADKLALKPESTVYVGGTAYCSIWC